MVESLDDILQGRHGVCYAVVCHLNKRGCPDSRTDKKGCFFIIPGFRTGDRRTVMKIKTLQEKEYDLVDKVLKETGWNLEKARRLLQIPLSQLKIKIKKHGMKDETSGNVTEPNNDLELER